MSKTRVLSRVERDLVISYLQEEEVTLTIQANTQYAMSGLIDSDQFEIENEAICIPITKTILWAEELTGEVNVSFYFKKRGLFFYSYANVKGRELSIIIPTEIYKQNDDKSKANKDFLCTVLFYASSKNTFKITVVSNKKYPLFDSRMWLTENFFEDIDPKTFFLLLNRFTMAEKANIPLMLADLFTETKKILLLLNTQYEKTNIGKLPDIDPFKSKSCITLSDVIEKGDETYNVLNKLFTTLQCQIYIPLGDDVKYCVGIKTPFKKGLEDVGQKVKRAECVLYFLPVCRYLAQNPAKKPAIQGKSEALCVLFITDEYIIFGGKSYKFPFQAGQTYKLKLNIKFRFLYVDAVVKKIYQNADRSVAFCMLDSIKPEDKRFLYESFYGEVLK